MRVEPFDLSHLSGAVANRKQAHFQALLESDVISKVGRNWSVIDGEGLICVGGMVDTDDGIEAWVLFTENITPARFVVVYREFARRLTKMQETGKAVFIHVDPTYPEAVRMAEKLGFQVVGEELFGGRNMIRMVTNV